MSCNLLCTRYFVVLQLFGDLLAATFVVWLISKRERRTHLKRRERECKREGEKERERAGLSEAKRICSIERRYAIVGALSPSLF